MVKADCRDCEGCSACCRGMGSSIILDPMDIWRFSQGTKQDFTALMSAGIIELGIVDGMILPNLKMDGGTDACPFLDDGVQCTASDRDCAGCFPLGAIMRRMDSATLSRSMNAGRKTGGRSRSGNGWGSRT